MNITNTTTVNTLKAYSRQATTTEREKLQKNVRELVGQVFFGTLLKQTRSEMDPENPLNGGKTGQTFTAQLDQLIVSKWADSTNFKIGQKIADQWMGTDKKS